MVDQKLLSEALKTELAPALRRVGFKGSGKQFRRPSSDCIHVINVQLRSVGGSFAINLGLQPLDIPDVRGNDPDAKSITDDLCEFRQRLTDTGVDHWWEFASADEAIVAVRQSVATYLLIGEHKFSNQTGPTSPLRRITPEQFDKGAFDFSGFSSTRVRMARALALMRRSDGNEMQARQFASLGLKYLGSASGLKRELETIAAGSA